MKRFLIFIVVICCFMMSCSDSSSLENSSYYQDKTVRLDKFCKIKDNVYIVSIHFLSNKPIYYLVNDKDSIISNIVIDGGELNIKETK